MFNVVSWKPSRKKRHDEWCLVNLKSCMNDFKGVLASVTHGMDTWRKVIGTCRDVDLRR